MFQSGGDEAEHLLVLKHLCLGLLIVFENDRLTIVFCFVFKNNRFAFGKEQLFLKTTHSF